MKAALHQANTKKMIDDEATLSKMPFIVAGRWSMLHRPAQTVKSDSVITKSKSTALKIFRLR
jgi:hypothetical protein